MMTEEQRAAVEAMMTEQRAAQAAHLAKMAVVYHDGQLVRVDSKWMHNELAFIVGTYRSVHGLEYFRVQQMNGCLSMENISKWQMTPADVSELEGLAFSPYQEKPDTSNEF